MRIFKVELTETVTGVAEVAARDEEHAVEIAMAVLQDDGLAAFADLAVVERDFYACEPGDAATDSTETIEDLRRKLEDEWEKDPALKDEQEKEKEE